MSETTQSIDQLKNIVSDLLAEARKQGADTAEAAVNRNTGQAVSVRMGELETVEHTNDQTLGVTVYFGQRKGSASTTDLRPAAVRETVEAACRIARYGSEDPYAGLADPEFLAEEVPDLDLHHPWDLSVDAAGELAQRCEQAARDVDPKINNSEGASVDTNAGEYVYGNSHGFVGGYAGSRHSLSCAILAEDGQGMQRDYWHTSGRLASELDSAESVGRRAGERAVARLGARKLSTRQVPVLFRAEIATGLLRSLTAALQGHAQYRRSTFLLDAVGEQILPDWVRIHEDPLRPRAMSAAPFDHEGVATRARDLIDAGVVQGYVLDAYAARRLKLDPTGNAGGVRNLAIDGGELDLNGLLKEMGTGLLVTELLGHGSNLVTGDYSRGASGFWVENGEIAYPVEEITVAGNLRDMYKGLIAVGGDNDIPSSIKTGSWLIERMTVAGE